MAAAGWPRKRRCVVGHRRRQQCFNVAAAGWPRKPWCSTIRGRKARCFNVAAAGWPRKRRNGSGKLPSGYAASMWPRLVGRGNHLIDAWGLAGTLKLQCGRGWLAAETSRRLRALSRPRSSFNVAAAGWPRKLDEMTQALSVISRLQCGRGWLAAETDLVQADGHMDRQLQCGRGWLAAET